MNPGKSLAGSAVVYTLTNALTAAIPFLLLPVLTRVLSPEEYGIVTMFSVVVSVLGAFTGLNVHGAVGVRYFQRDKYNFEEYVSSCLLVLLVSTFVVFLLVTMLLPLLEEFTRLPGKWLLIAVLVSCCQFVILTQLAIFQASKQPWRYGGLRIAQFLVDAVASLTFVVALGLAWQGRAAGIALAFFIAATAALILMRKGGWFRLTYRRAYIKDALRFGVPLVPHALGGMLIAAVDRFMISNILDIQSTGIYMVALQIGMMLRLLTDSFNKAYAPWLFEALGSDDTTRDRKIVRFTYLYFAVVLVLALLIGRLAPEILSVLVGEEFRSAAPIVIYITIGFAFGGMYFMVTNYVFFAGRTGSLAVITLSCGILNVAISYLMLQRFGLVGAAIAYMTVQGLLFVGTWILAQRSRPMPWLTSLAGVAR